MGTDKLAFYFKAERTGFFTVPRAIAAIKGLGAFLQLSIIAHGISFHPVVFKIHFITKDIINSNVIRTGR
jgi:hypothetical protein